MAKYKEVTSTDLDKRTIELMIKTLKEEGKNLVRSFFDEDKKTFSLPLKRGEKVLFKLEGKDILYKTVK